MANDVVRTITRNFSALVRQANPHFDREKRKEIQYEFSNGRKFYGDPDRTGVYSPTND